MHLNTKDYDIIEERSSVLVAKFDLEGRFISFGKKWLDFLGMTSDELEGTLLNEFIILRDHQTLKDAIETTQNSEDAFLFELRIIGANNRLVPMRCEIFCANSIVYLRCLDSTRTNLWNSAMSDISSRTKIGAWYHDPIIDKTTWSEECYELFDMDSSTEIHSDTFFNFLTPEDQIQIKELAEKLSSEHQSYEYLCKISTLKGEEKWIKTIAEPITFNEKLVFVKGMNIDVTEEHNLTQELQHKNRIQLLALKGIRSGLFHHDLKRNIVMFSNEFKKMIGIENVRKELTEEEFRSHIVEEDQQEAHERHLEQLEKTSNYYTNHYRLEHSDGTIQHYEEYAWKQRNDKGEITEMVGNLINIEKRVQAELEVKSHVNKLESIIENAFMSTLILDVDRTIINADKRSVEYIKQEFGLDIKAHPTKFEDVTPANLVATFHKEFDKALKGEIIIKETETLLFSGKSMWLGIEYKPIRDSEGVISNVGMYFIDLSSKKQAELVNDRAEFKFTQIEKLKRNLLNGFSYEIRTPLNGITGAVEILKKDQSSEQIKKTLEILSTSSDRLLDTANKITNLNLLHYENNNYPNEPLDLKKIVQESFERHLHMANVKDIVLTTSFEDRKMIVNANDQMLRIVINNLLNNAIKYTDEGHVSIMVKKDKFTENVNVSFIDSGIGITSEGLERIFLDFEQESYGIERKYEGTGIGLSISKKYINSLNGNLNVISQLHKGSTFILSLPLLS